MAAAKSSGEEWKPGIGRGKRIELTVWPKMVQWPRPFNTMTMAKKWKNGRMRRDLPNTRGESASRIITARINPVSQSRNSKVGMGQKPNVARSATTVGWETERKPVRAYSMT
jgi:hypothetical protein